MTNDQKFLLGLVSIAAITYVAIYAIDRKMQIRLSNPLLSLEAV